MGNECVAGRKTTFSLDVMQSKPGIYVLLLRYGTALVEVAEEGRCFQLDILTYERDGELAADGWNMAAIGAILGPFKRA